jgi:NarL family two-component system response regulator LiaR
MITILLVDDQPAVRRGLRMRLALEPDVTVVGEADDGVMALDLARTLRPDVVIMDVVMPGLDGLDATAQMRVAAPASAVVVLSLYDDSGTRARAAECGAVAFVGKHETPDTLPAAIREATGHGSASFAPRPE